MDAYAKALRRIASGVLGLESGKKKGTPKPGTQAWRSKIDATPLDKITPAAVLAWKNSFLRSAETPQLRNSAAVTVNSLLRNSKALLSKKIRPFLEAEMALPSPLWFEGIPSEKEGSLRYTSKIDAGTILAAANSELATQDPEAFKALLLTLICGLRRSEADAVEWAQFNFDAGTLEVRDTDARALKSADSAGTIGLDAEFVTVMRGFKAKARKQKFVLATPTTARKPQGEHTSRTYRCDATHNRLLSWLRKNGVNGKRPIHTLRKEIGSIIASRDGIFAASRYLRHSDIRITSRLYADTKKLVSAGLGGMLSPASGKVVEMAFVDSKGASDQPAKKEAKA